MAGRFFFSCAASTYWQNFRSRRHKGNKEESEKVSNKTQQNSWKKLKRSGLKYGSF